MARPERAEACDRCRSSAPVLCDRPETLKFPPRGWSAEGSRELRPPTQERHRFWAPGLALRAIRDDRELLDRDGLREVARLVDVFAHEDGGVIGDELDRQRVDDRGYDRVHVRHHD